MAVVILLLWALCLTCSAYEIKNITKPVIMGESPFWDSVNNTMIFVDVIGKQVLRYDPANDDLKSISFSHMRGRVTPAVPVYGTSSHQLLVGIGCTLHLVQVKWGAVGEQAVVQSLLPLAEVDKDKPGNRFNDGKADRFGILWIGTMDDGQTARRRRRRSASKPNKGALYRFELSRGTDGAPAIRHELVLRDQLLPNGMVWTEDGRSFYLADSTLRAIYRYDVHPGTSTGTTAAAGYLTNRTLVFSFPEHNVPGTPDGITIDIEGKLWVACVHGGLVIRVDPDPSVRGRLLQRIEIPAKSVSAVEWGGPKRDVLYVVTARFKMNESELQQQPLAGSTFTITGLGTSGRLDVPYSATASTSSSRSSAGLSRSSTELLVLLLSSLYLLHHSS